MPIGKHRHAQVQLPAAATWYLVGPCLCGACRSAPRQPLRRPPPGALRGVHGRRALPTARRRIQAGVPQGAVGVLVIHHAAKPTEKN
jgi:hypothetical protein